MRRRRLPDDNLAGVDVFLAVAILFLLLLELEDLGEDLLGLGGGLDGGVVAHVVLNGRVLVQLSAQQTKIEGVLKSPSVYPTSNSVTNFW